MRELKQICYFSLIAYIYRSRRNSFGEKKKKFWLWMVREKKKTAWASLYNKLAPSIPDLPGRMIKYMNILLWITKYPLLLNYSYLNKKTSQTTAQLKENPGHLNQWTFTAGLYFLREGGQSFQKYIVVSSVQHRINKQTFAEWCLGRVSGLMWRFFL